MNEIVPAVSVVISIYNPQSCSQAALESVLNQAFSDFEIVMIDDGSDESQTYNLFSQLKHNRLLRIIRIKHRGLAGALNVGIREAKGRYIARMDADDVALPDRLGKQLDFLERNPDIAVVGTGYHVLRTDGSKSNPKVPLLLRSAEIKQALPRFNPMFHGSIMMRKDALLEVGGYDESFLLAQDYDLWLRLSGRYQFANLPEVLMLRREDDKTVQKESKQNWYGIKARVNAIKRGDLTIWDSIHLIRPFFVAIAPIWIKELVRKFIFRHE